MKRKTLVEFASVSKSFPTREDPVNVLRNLNFTIPLGSFTILFGPSGSGKSTILNTMIGLEPPSDGVVLVHGINLYSFNQDQRAKFRSQMVGTVYQSDYWVNSLSVLENVALPLYLSGWQKAKARDYALKSISRVGMPDYAHYQPNVLSGGERQRISFARATVNAPYILVADEPTGNLDSNNGNQIIKMIQSYNEDFGSTIVLVTHNADFLTYADNLLTISDGEVTQKMNTKLQREVKKDTDDEAG